MSLAVLVTPSEACRLWVGPHHEARPLDLAKVVLYADSARLRTWPAHRPRLELCPDGHVRNGNHHLAAIMLAGVASPMELHTTGECGPDDGVPLIATLRVA